MESSFSGTIDMFLGQILLPEWAMAPRPEGEQRLTSQGELAAC